jgi:hypothetical protein
MMFTIARSPGQCRECACRYRPGEVIVLGADASYHADCYRTRGTYAVRPYEDQQPAALDRLLAVIQAEDLLAGQPSI